MADHLSRQIRAAAASAVTGLATTGTNVHEQRVYPLDEAGLPALLVYLGDEEVEALSLSTTPTQRRLIELFIAGVVHDTDPVDDTLDAIAKEVETALLADGTLGGLAKQITLTGTSRDAEVEGTKVAAAIELAFAVEYHTRAGTPDAQV